MNVPWLMQIKVDKSAQKAIYVQIADEIIRSIKKRTVKSRSNFTWYATIGCWVRSKQEHNNSGFGHSEVKI